MLTVVANGIIICVSKLPPDFKFKDQELESTQTKGTSNSIQNVLHSLSSLLSNQDVSNTFGKKMNSGGVNAMINDLDKWNVLARKMDRVCFFAFTALVLLVSVVFAFLIF